jgi:branched chain amino acid efflux pump
VSVAPYLHGGVLSRFFHAQLTVDETWIVAAEGEGRFNPKVLLAAGLVLYAAWVSGTALGVLFGDLIGDPAAWGLDAAFPALFLALLVPQLHTRDARLAAAIGAAIALVLTPFTPPGVPIIAASAGALVGSVGRLGGRGDD